MSVEIEFYTVIVQRDALERLPQEAQDAFQRGWVEDDLFHQDRHLAATVFMGPQDVARCAGELEDLGLVVFGPDGAYQDVAVVQEGMGFLHPCPWLELNWDPGRFHKRIEMAQAMGGRSVLLELSRDPDDPPCCWLTGHPRGTLTPIPYLGKDPQQRSETRMLSLPLDGGQG